MDARKGGKIWSFAWLLTGGRSAHREETNMCDFCENGKKMKADYKGEGITTAINMIDALFGAGDDDSFCAARIENNILFVDNSSREYAELGVEIKYCPMCGRSLI